MNEIVELKGTFDAGRFKGRVGAPSLPKEKKVSLEHINTLIEELNVIYKKWQADTIICGALVDVCYISVVAKSNRIKALLKETGKKSSDSIRGARFNDAEKKNPKHIFTHFISLDALLNTINKLSVVAQFINDNFGGIIDTEGVAKINKGLYKSVLSKSELAQIIVDVYYVDRFSLPEMQIKEEEKNIVTLFRTGVNSLELLRSIGVQPDTNENLILGEDTFLLSKKDLDIINERIPYIISMGVSDVSTWDISDIDDTYESVISIPKPKNEPIVGVIDTQFDESVYFSDWVETQNMLPEDISIRPQDKKHATEICSIIVDGPTINPKLDDGCGRFRVKHFGVATSGKTSSLFVMRSIKKIVENNLDIKVWNISLGAINEIPKNFVSPEGALLDRLQNEYDIVFVVAGTNKLASDIGEKRIGAPADSLNSVVVNAVDFDNKPASYGRVGPVLSFFHKPDVSYYGGDKDEGIFVCSSLGEAVKTGTSYAAPWITRKMAYLICRMGLSREVAKALLIDSAAKWDRQDNVSFNVGYGVVPVRIEDILKTRDDEIRFIITNTITEYETFTYNIPIPRNDKGFPFLARATLVYYPKCNRNQGVDYTCTELDVHFGRAREKDGKTSIESINRNAQGEENGVGLFEGSARRVFRKWDNVKHISERLNPRARAKSVLNSNNWGLMIRCTERLEEKNGRGMKFGVVITMREIEGVNRMQQFINLCRVRGWIVNELSIDNRNDIYNIGEQDIELE